MEWLDRMNKIFQDRQINPAISCKSCPNIMSEQGRLRFIKDRIIDRDVVLDLVHLDPEAE